MRVAVVDPYFAIGIGYQTTSWFNALVAQGHHVRAFCSCHVSTSVRHLYDRPFPEGLVQVGGGDALRMRVRLLPRDIVYCSGLLREVQAFSPDATLAIYPGTMFARELIDRRHELPGSLFCTFGENSAQYRVAVPSLRTTIHRMMVNAAFQVIKRRYYRRAMEVSDAALLQTPNTFDHLLPRVAVRQRREQIKQKCVLSPLGFEASVFYPNPEMRRAERQRLGFKDDEVVALFSCKIDAVKRLDIWVSIMAAAMKRVPKLRAMLIGIREGDVESAKVLSWIENTGLKDRFVCLSFTKREQLPRLYSAVDFGVWYLQPSIGIQEAMGTGLYMVLNKCSTISHLVVDPETGRYFPPEDYEQATELVVETADAFRAGEPLSCFEARRDRAALNAGSFSSEVLVEQFVAAAQDLPNAVTHLQFKRQRRSDLVGPVQ